MPAEGAEFSQTPAKRKLGIVETIKYIMRKDGIAAFWRGLGPALVLVINPILQVRMSPERPYTNHY
jgi:adenine nucleotide transporter 17